MAEGQTCYERDETFCEDQMCLRTGCRLQNAKHRRREGDAVDLAYELNEALTVYFDAKAIETEAGYEGYAVQAQSELLQILWDNKAGIIAHLLAGVEANSLSPDLKVSQQPTVSSEPILISNGTGEAVQSDTERTGSPIGQEK